MLGLCKAQRNMDGGVGLRSPRGYPNMKAELPNEELQRREKIENPATHELKSSVFEAPPAISGDEGLVHGKSECMGK